MQEESRKERKKLRLPNSTMSIHHISLPSTLQIHQWSKKKAGIAVGIRCCLGKGRLGTSRPEDDYYGLLGVSVDSTPQQIKEAYRRLQKKYHPDIAGQRGHDFTLKLNKAYHALMRDDLWRRYDVSNGKRMEGFESNFSGLGYSSWIGPPRSQALFVDEKRCIGCRECVHHASKTFVMDETLGCARVKVQYGDDMDKIEVSLESCPVNCIHWVEREELPVLEFLTRPQPKEAHGVFGGGWERPADVFRVADSFKKQQSRTQQQQDHRRQENYYAGQADIEGGETPAQVKARHDASLKLRMGRFSELWKWLMATLQV